jgi:hypothetical protein
MKNLFILILIISNHLLKGFDFVVVDILNYNGKKYEVTSDPLAVLFDKYPSIRPKSDLVTIGQDKHYEAEFVIVKEQLYLTAIIVIKYDSLQGNFVPINIIRDVFCCDTLNMNWLTTTMVSIDGSGKRIFNFNSGKLISTQWIRYYNDYLLYLNKYIKEFKTNERITYNILDDKYKSLGINNFRNVVKLNLINIFAICSRVDETILNAILVGEFY